MQQELHQRQQHQQQQQHPGEIGLVANLLASYHSTNASGQTQPHQQHQQQQNSEGISLIANLLASCLLGTALQQQQSLPQQQTTIANNALNGNGDVASTALMSLLQDVRGTPDGRLFFMFLSFLRFHLNLFPSKRTPTLGAFHYTFGWLTSCLFMVAFHFFLLQTEVEYIGWCALKIQTARYF